MLKSVSSHLTCSFLIQDYLEWDNERNRALAHDFVNLYFDEQKQWAEVMDRTRHQVGNDRAWCGKQAVTYQQFVISPNPADNVDLETLREFTMEWVHEFFGNGTERGILGDYQVAVVYHDDNDAGIPHAHVVVNNTDLETCRRLHIDPTQNDALQDRLQDMAKERGLSFFDNKSTPKKERIFRGSFITRTERERINKGLWCYKQDLRNMVNIASRTSHDEVGFLTQIERLGAHAYIKDGDYVFEHPVNPGRNHVTGYRLGKAFSREALLYEREAMAFDGAPRSEQVARNVARHIESYVSDMKIVACINAWTTLEDAAYVLRVNDTYSITSLKDYGRAEARLKRGLVDARSLGDPDADLYVEAIESIQRAREIARDSGFFDGVQDCSSETQKSTALPATPKGSASAGGRQGGSGSRPKLQKAIHKNNSGSRRPSSSPRSAGGGSPKR